MATRAPWWLKWALGGAALGGVLVFSARKAFAKEDPWDFGPPLETVTVTQGWWEPRAYRGGVHNGLDLRAKTGTPVYAVADGVVSRVHRQADSPAGIHVILQHANGMYSRYLHLNEIMPGLDVGTPVTKGQPIALSGRSGVSMTAFSPHLHFDLRLLKEALSLYVARFGTPTTGWGDARAVGGGVTAVAVPAEPFIPGMYNQRVINRAAKFGFPVRHIG